MEETIFFPPEADQPLAEEPITADEYFFPNLSLETAKLS